MKKELSAISQRGFSLIEAIIAAALFFLIVSSIIGSLFFVRKSISSSGSAERATYLAEEGLEAARNIRDSNFSGLSDGVHGLSLQNGLRIFSGSEDQKGDFKRKITVSSVNSSTKKVESAVSWTEDGTAKKVSLSEELTNWRKGKILSHWPFDENSGCTAYDKADSNDGTLKPNCPTNSPLWAPGKVHSALNFDGVDDYVEIPDSNSLDLSAAGTIMLWFKADTFVNRAGLFHKGSKSNNQDEAYYMVFDNNQRLQAGGRSHGNNFITTTKKTFSNANQWYHVAFTWDAAGMKIYVDGQLDNSSSAILVADTTDGSLQIGSQFPSRYFFDGMIDEVYLFDTALSAQDILDIYNAEK